VGCSSCANGYRGRFAILEALPVDEDIKRLVIERRSAMEMKNSPPEQGHADPPPLRPPQRHARPDDPGRGRAHDDG
jgi:hypothetical protein